MPETGPGKQIVFTKELAGQIRSEIQKIIVGQDRAVDHLIMALLSGGHVLLEGVPGTAKTLMVKALAWTVSSEFKRIQFTPDLMPSDVIGTNVFDNATSGFVLKKGPVFTNLLLVDEVNRSPAKTQAALLEVMEERQVTVDGVRYELQEPFLVCATQNPIEYEGTYALPEAQLDRFMFKIVIDYPGEVEEEEILKKHHLGFNPHELKTSRVKKCANWSSIEKARKEILGVTVHDDIIKYINEVIRKTRTDASIAIGASPRAAIAVLQSSKTLAAMNGRSYVTPDDVKMTVHPVLRHRIFLHTEAEIEGTKPDDIVDEILNQTKVPK